MWADANNRVGARSRLYVNKNDVGAVILGLTWKAKTGFEGWINNDTGSSDPPSDLSASEGEQLVFTVKGYLAPIRVRYDRNGVQQEATIGNLNNYQLSLSPGVGQTYDNFVIRGW